MQASSVLSDALTGAAKYLWKKAANFAANIAEALTKVGLHKQATNRILEPFQTMKTVMTATCMDNFFWLRNHEDAQPEIRELARLMWEALQNSTPNKLEPGDWHVPYYNEGYTTGVWRKTVNTDKSEAGVRLQDALAISSSCCAQVSYRKLDDTLEKAQMVYKRLVDSEPVHASPFEHQATPMLETVYEVNDFMCATAGINDPHDLGSWQRGITHVDRSYNFWSGNFIGWIQHRQLIPNNVCMKYEVSNESE